MTEEELKKKQIRFNRWALLIALLLVAGGFVLAILRDSDWWAFGGCAAPGAAHVKVDTEG